MSGSFDERFGWYWSNEIMHEGDPNRKSLEAFFDEVCDREIQLLTEIQKIVAERRKVFRRLSILRTITFIPDVIYTLFFVGFSAAKKRIKLQGTLIRYIFGKATDSELEDDIMENG